MSTEKPSLLEKTEMLTREEEHLLQGDKTKQQIPVPGKLPVRQRLELLLDHPDNFFELGIWAGYQLYSEAGTFPCAAVVTGIGQVAGRQCMVIANDPDLFGGALFPQSVKKILRAQKIAYLCRLPIIYLLDTCGIYTPRQDESFPDEDDAGRIIRNSAVIARIGISQIAAIMGRCSSTTSTLPLLCNKVLMTEGSVLYTSDPATVKAAIGQLVEHEELGGARMHSEVSGTIDFLEKDDRSCLMRLRSQVELLPQDPPVTQKNASFEVEHYPYNVYEITDMKGAKRFNSHDILSCIIDRGSLQEFKARYGTSLITAYAKINGFSIGIIANQREGSSDSNGNTTYGGVLYAQSAEKAARFINDCNQMHMPVLFLQDIDALMMGVQAERTGIIRSTARLVSAISNCTIPKITVITGNSFGPGSYALCGKAFDPHFIFAWPNAKFTCYNLVCPAENKNEDAADIFPQFEFFDATYGAARGWVDGVIAPHKTREVVSDVLSFILRHPTIDYRLHGGGL